MHLDLIGMGIDEGYYDGTIQREEYLITLYEIGSLFEKYFKSIFGESYYFDPYGYFCPPNVSVPIKINYLSMLDGHSYNVVINKMSELVDAGIPVIYFGSSYEYSDTSLLPDVEGHFMIAYDTVKTNGEINDFIMHTGWSNKTGSNKYSKKLSELTYDKNASILWFEINESMIPHNCSDNYVFAGGETACSCELYGDLHPAHEHKPANGAEMCPSANKTADCICGEKVNGAHRYVNPFYTSSSHWYECACGENSEPTSHVLTEYTNYSSEEHKHSCECGYTVYEQHDLTQRIESSDYHITECICGYYEEEPHVLTFGGFSVSGHTLVCECGYTREETHTLSYDRETEVYHRLVCDCGYSYNEDHTLTYQDYHTDTCVCGYTYTTPHNFTYQEGSDENHHIATCECGYDDEVWHTYTYRSISDSYHSRICPCGYIASEENHTLKRLDFRYSACAFCDYVRDNFGSIGNIIKGEKTEEEKE